MLEVAVEGALKGLGAFLFGLLLVAVLRFFSRSAADDLEKALNLPAMGKPTHSETPPIAEPLPQPSLREIAEYTDIVPADSGGDLLSDSDLSSRGSPKS